MRTPLLAAFAALIATGTAVAAPVEPDFLTQREAWKAAQLRCLRDAVYTEARGEDDLGQLMVAWVVAQRALENRSYWGGGTICKVVYATSRNKNGSIVTQFAGPVYNPVTVRDDDPQLRRAEQNARRVLLLNWQPQGKLHQARFYQNPKTADPKRGRWFKGPVGSIGNHVFYKG
jgi:spore germination cell wall hydrolase CwlJ-like protein